MHRCPHCQQPTISNAQKLWAVGLRPVVCSRCGRPSFVPFRHAVAALFVWAGMTWALIVTALYSANVLYLIGSPLAAVFAIDFCVLRATLQKLP